MNIKNNYNSTPLHWAVQFKGNEETIQVLLDFKADVNAKDQRGSTPLHWAVAEESEVERVKILLKKGANVNARDDTDGYTCLHEAAQVENNVEILKLLVENGADINARDNEGRTPLYWAVFSGHTQNVDTLLEMNSDFFCTSKLIDELIIKAGENDLDVKKTTDILVMHLIVLKVSNLLTDENYKIWKNTMISHSQKLKKLYHAL